MQVQLYAAENNTFKVTNTGTMTYEERKNTEFSLHGCMDQAENMLENLQREIASDNMSAPYENLKESDSKETISSNRKKKMQYRIHRYLYYVENSRSLS
jgi:hypothetical protein